MNSTPIKAALAALVLSQAAWATTLTFDSPGALGIALGGQMTWNGTGGGHLYAESWNSDDQIIFFNNATTVNRFEMNAMPWQNYGGGSIGLIDIDARDSSGNVVWQETVDLTAYTNWNDWLTVEVNTANVAQLFFHAPGNAPHYNGFWPSVDNLTINEALNSVPSGGSTGIMLGLLLLGFGAVKRKLK